MTKSDERELLRSVRGLVTTTREKARGYAAGQYPMSTADFTSMISQLGCRRVLVDLPPESDGSVRAAALPMIGGFRWITVRRDLSVWERTFAERHELGHILNGDADDFIQLADRGYETWAERKADLFAMADLFPTQLFEAYRRAGFTWKGIIVEIRKAIAADFGPRWPAERVKDRARLRVLLYREYGI